MKTALRFLASPEAFEATFFLGVVGLVCYGIYAVVTAVGLAR